MVNKLFHLLDRNSRLLLVILLTAFVANSIMNTIITIEVVTSTELQLQRQLNNQTVNDLRNTIDVLKTMLQASLSINRHNLETIEENQELLNNSLSMHNITQELLMQTIKVIKNYK